jgi:hypothetical protein
MAMTLKPIVSKKDVDFLFGLNASGWQQEAKKFFRCDWSTKVGEGEMSNRIMGFQPSTGMSVSLQPMYSNDDDPPFMIIVASYIPLAGLPPISDEMMQEIRRSLRHNLGAAYDVRCRYRPAAGMGLLEIVLTQSTSFAQTERPDARKRISVNTSAISSSAEPQTFVVVVHKLHQFAPVHPQLPRAHPISSFSEKIRA